MYSFYGCQSLIIASYLLKYVLQMESFVEILKIVLPAALVVYAMFLAIRTMISKNLVEKQLDIKSKAIEITLPARMQAFERMTLFLERIAPDSLLVRINRNGMSADELHHIVLQEIRNEFNHNVAQQVYLNKELWSMIVTAKEDLLTRINATYQEMEPEASSIDYAKKLIASHSASEVNSIELALTSLKDELGKYYEMP